MCVCVLCVCARCALCVRCRSLTEPFAAAAFLVGPVVKMRVYVNVDLLEPVQPLDVGRGDVRLVDRAQESTVLTEEVRGGVRRCEEV